MSLKTNYPSIDFEIIEKSIHDDEVRIQSYVEIFNNLKADLIEIKKNVFQYLHQLIELNKKLQFIYDQTEAESTILTSSAKLLYNKLRQDPQINSVSKDEFRGDLGLYKNPEGR